MATSTDASTHSHGTAEHTREDFAHPSPVRTLLLTFGALVLLTILTVVLGVGFDLGRWEVWVSLGIATVKATLVICFFMHMLHDKPFNALFFLGSLLFVALFIGITLMDSSNYQPSIQAIEGYKTEDVPAYPDRAPAAPE